MDYIGLNIITAAIYCYLERESFEISHEKLLSLWNMRFPLLGTTRP